MKKSSKVKWQKIYMAMTLELAKGSKDDKIKVGSMLVTEDYKNVVSVAVNGGPIGGLNKRKSMKTGCSGFIHSEDNLLTKGLQEGILSGGMYAIQQFSVFCTHLPCSKCAEMISDYNFEITAVYYKYEYKSNAKKIFKQAGIKCHKISL